MKQEFHDSNNRLIGTIRPVDGRLEGRDASGRLKGAYDPKTGQTRDGNGRIIGRGNVLAAVVTSPLFH